MNLIFKSLLVILSLNAMLCNAQNCNPNQKTLVVSVTTDNYHIETSWEVKNSLGQILFEKSYELLQNDTTYLDTLCIPDNQCIQFIIKDSEGDGICCRYGNGWYSIA